MTSFALFLPSFMCLLCYFLQGKVDTGTGGTGDGAGVQHARCLVRALCRLLRRVSLHAVLKGAGQTASTAVSDTTDDASGGQFALTEVRVAFATSCRIIEGMIYRLCRTHAVISIAVAAFAPFASLEVLC